MGPLKLMLNCLYLLAEQDAVVEILMALKFLLLRLLSCCCLRLEKHNFLRKTSLVKVCYICTCLTFSECSS